MTPLQKLQQEYNTQLAYALLNIDRRRRPTWPMSDLKRWQRIALVAAWLLCLYGIARAIFWSIT